MSAILNNAVVIVNASALPSTLPGAVVRMEAAWDGYVRARVAYRRARQNGLFDASWRVESDIARDCFVQAWVHVKALARQQKVVIHG